MVPAQACHRSVMIDGKNYRTVRDTSWDVSKRLADLADMDLALQAISPMPELLSYWLAAPAAAQLVRYLNEQIAAMVAESGGRLVGLGAVPLQNVDKAIDELRYIMATPGFAGVELGSNVNGKPLGHAEFDPFFEACEALGAAVFVHALRPAGMARLVGPPALEQVLGYPTDLGLGAASVITSNLIERRPNLRIAFSHGGGTLAMLLPRLQQGWGVFPGLKEALHASPAEQARKLFYDTLVFDAPTLQHLLLKFGPTQLMIGTDYPFNFQETRPVSAIETAVQAALQTAVVGTGIDDSTVQKLVHENARRFLGTPL